MRLSNFTFLLWASLCLLCSGIGCSNSSTYEPLWNPPQQTDPEEPEEPDDVSFVVYNHLADSPDVNVSTVWEVTLSQNGVEKECMVFQSTCPVDDPSAATARRSNWWPAARSAGRTSRSTAR